MTKGMLLFLLICSVAQVSAQSGQVKLYLQQIAANMVLIEYIQQGYKIARKGLTTIGSIKNGEFSLHRDYFGSLKAINPKIKNSAIVVDIITLQSKIIKSYSSTYKRVKESGQFTDSEINYISWVVTKVLDNTATTLEELLSLVTADHYQMRDDERLKRIAGLDANMKSIYVFAQHFENNCLLQITLRIKEKQDVGTSRILNGIVPTQNH